MSGVKFYLNNIKINMKLYCYNSFLRRLKLLIFIFYFYLFRNHKLGFKVLKLKIEIQLLTYDFNEFLMKLMSNLTKTNHI